MRHYGLLVLVAALGACGDDSDSDGDQTADSGTLLDATITDSGGSTSADGGSSPCASESTQQARVACAANAVLATLSTTQLAAVQFPLTDYTTRSKWSNLPVQMKPRAGTQMGNLSATSQAAVLALMNIALNDNGQSTLNGIRAADDYLGSMQGGYGSGLYSIAIFGTPSVSNDFEIMFGGHHMAYNLNFKGGSFYPVPLHLGCEPKAAFTVSGVSYEPMTAKGDAMFAIYTALDSTQKTSSYLTGQTFSDVVVNPDLDYGKGSGRTSGTAYPTGDNRKGVLVSSLTPAQQALVTAAVEQWVRQYPTEVADKLMTDYQGAYSDTLFAWGGSSSGPDKEVNGSYLRLDGPRLWIELSVQGGIVIRNVSHYHSIYHDKTYDYGGEF